MPDGMGPFADRKKLREFVNHVMDTLEDQKIIGFRLQADTGAEELESLETTNTARLARSAGVGLTFPPCARSLWW